MQVRDLVPRSNKLDIAEPQDIMEVEDYKKIIKLCDEDHTKHGGPFGLVCKIAIQMFKFVLITHLKEHGRWHDGSSQKK